MPLLLLEFSEMPDFDINSLDFLDASSLRLSRSSLAPTAVTVMIHFDVTLTRISRYNYQNVSSSDTSEWSCRRVTLIQTCRSTLSFLSSLFSAVIFYPIRHQKFTSSSSRSTMLFPCRHGSRPSTTGYTRHT